MILFLSNGHGEDLIGATLARRVREALTPTASGPLPTADPPTAAISPTAAILPTLQALAVVGEGRPYLAAGVPLVGPRRVLPSGGFTRNSLANLWADLRAGLLSLLWRQGAALRRLRPETDLVVAVGDILVLFLARRVLRRPTVFLPTAKSDYIAPHFQIEVALMRECFKVYPRDALTAAHLAEQGVPAEYVGNAMMDCLDLSGVDLRPALGASAAPSDPAPQVVGLLPGSREEAYLNLADLTAVAARLVRLASQPLAFPVALAPSLDPARATEAIRSAGGDAQVLDSEATAEPPPTFASAAGRPLLTLIQGRFGDVLLASDVVIGLAGTANEQAAGLGRPVVTFPGRGAQFTPRFARAQQRLLGEAVVLVEPPDPARVAEITLHLLADSAERQRRAAVGRERMGGPGATGRMAAGIVDAWTCVSSRRRQG
ncbi:MAG TPA: hypothetical protein GXX28_01555 [Firmicutes bacterium]|nr:hypothetical protein [Bacillota bacterium]